MSLKEPRSEWVMGIWGGGQKYTMLGANINQPHLGTIKKLVQPESKIWTLHWSEVE